MKIEYLEIKNYKQFTDLTLDLTYPRGHEKEGQPLDKICIIGQSGTGKTNLLKIIRDKKSDDAVKTVFREEDSSFEKIYFSEAEKVLQKSQKYRKTINIHSEKSWEYLQEKIDNYEKEKQAYKSKLFNKVMSNAKI